MTAPRPATPRLPQWLVLGLVCLAGLLLEVAYTRIISYKLWYYYTYLVIGLSLLGIGSGGILVALWAPLRRATTERIVAVSAILGAATIVGGYAAIARLPVDTVAIWDYGSRTSFRNIAMLGVMCVVLFVPFIALGVTISTILGRARDSIGRLYFADLAGAGLGCLLAIPLISRLSPPQVVALAALVFAVVGVLALPRRLTPMLAAGVVVAAVVGVGVARESAMPSVRVEETKLDTRGALHSEWGPVFRVDVIHIFPDDPNRLLVHDGTYGSGIWEFDGDLSSLGRYDTDSRAIPFDVLGDPPTHELIVGSAGGQEILASLHRGSQDIEAVELNPVTVSLLTDHFADYTGHLPDRPEVDLHQGDGRTYLARSDTAYDLVWFVAPDSYAANNAASSGAFVLSESYLYTTEMIEDTLRHLTDDGITVVQFGELDFDDAPLRTSRYVVTARDALEALGVEDASDHILVAVESNVGPDLTTIVVKRTPFTEAEVDAFSGGLADITNHVPVYAPGRDFGEHVVSRLAGGTAAEVDAIVADAPREIGAVTDDAPFFWHFSSFETVLGDLITPIETYDPEDSIGERVMLFLLGLAITLAAVFLLLPFAFARTDWSRLPAKRLSALYFACLGMGFMLYEITMIQRLVRFLGYPTYSLTVTLAAILVSTGIGALLSRRLAARSSSLMPALLGLIAALTIFYQLALDDLTDGLQSSGLGVRVGVAVLALAPLGVCLGMFMPLGLGLVGGIGEHGEEYVAWSWAVNGFFSVIGSVLTTILSMEFGFRAVQYLALLVYAVAVVVFLRLRRAVRLWGERAAVVAPHEDPDVDVDLVPAPA